MLAAFLKDITWTAVTALALILLVCCVFAWFWSKREWNSRRFRVGMFLEREYKTDDETGDVEDAPDEDD